MSDTPTVVDPVDTRSWLRKQVEDLPQWAHTMVVLAVVGFVIYLIYTKSPAASVVTNAVVTPAPIAASVEPSEVKESTRIHPVKNLFLDVVKHRTKKALMTDGFLKVEGNPTKLTEAQVDKLFEHVDDATLMEAVQTKGLAPEGAVLDRLSALIDWLVSHSDQIEQLVKFLMSLLMLFA